MAAWFLHNVSSFKSGLSVESVIVSKFSRLILIVFSFALQAAHLLEAPKVSAEDIASISSTCFKLNSLQLRALLKFYRPDRSEPIIPPGMYKVFRVLSQFVICASCFTVDESCLNIGCDIISTLTEQRYCFMLHSQNRHSCVRQAIKYTYFVVYLKLAATSADSAC